MTTDTLPAGRRDGLPSVARLLTLSDSVVAIALTLLVLQLKVPPPAQVADHGSAAELAAQLAKEADALISYLIAFYVVAQFWLAHHRVFRRVAGHHEGLAWWNFAFLFTITAMPFTSNLLGEYGDNPLAVDIFAVNLLLATPATLATLLYGQRREVLTVPPDATEARAVGLCCAALSGQNPASPHLSPRVSRWLVLGSSVGYRSGRAVPVRLPGR
jgi:uncharacterized membrane protein